jgi:hypothetical protein
MSKLRLLEAHSKVVFLFLFVNALLGVLSGDIVVRLLGILHVGD